MTGPLVAGDAQHRPRGAADDDEAARRLAAKLRDVLADLGYLIEVWPWLIELRVPGSRKRWAQHDHRRAGVLSEAMLDSMGWKGVPRPAAADVSVLDVLARIDHLAAALSREVLDVLPQARRDVFQPTHAPSHDPRPWLRLSARLLPQASAATADDDDPVVVWAERRLSTLPTDVARLMGDVRDGQDLAGICPWCHGRTSRGIGEPTMRIHYPDHARGGGAPFDPDANRDDGAGAVIVCLGVNCSPPSHSCGQRWHGHPAWNVREWEWLAKQLGTPR
ncbi:MAG: hypothetical protein QM662_14135 [Gordonia sp. (in: high G+C Gram-positive bacteria)]